MAVYQTYIGAMNEKIRRQISISNPFVFKHISNLKGIDSFDDLGPSVVMASPGEFSQFQLVLCTNKARYSRISYKLILIKMIFRVKCG